MQEGHEREEMASPRGLKPKRSVKKEEKGGPEAYKKKKKEKEEKPTSRD